MQPEEFVPRTYIEKISRASLFGSDRVELTLFNPIFLGEKMSSSQILLAVLLFIFVFLSGFWLSRTGKPYGIMASAVHKLVGVGLGIFLVMDVYHRHQAVPFGDVEILMIAVMMILFISLVATGAIVSGEKTLPALSFIHKILPYLAVISTSVMLSLLH